MGCPGLHPHCHAVPSGLLTRLKPLCHGGTCVAKQGEIQVKLQPGGYYVGYGHVRIATTLGSCVAACIRDPFIGVGGMNHFMLPRDDQRTASARDPRSVGRYGEQAMMILVEELLRRGASRDRLEVKLFGGGHVARGMQSDVGERNSAFARQFVEEQGLRLSAADLGQGYARRLLYDVRSGRVQVKPLRRHQADEVSRRDARLFLRLGSQAPLAEVSS